MSPCVLRPHPFLVRNGLFVCRLVLLLVVVIVAIATVKRHRSLGGEKDKRLIKLVGENLKMADDSQIDSNPIQT